MPDDNALDKQPASKDVENTPLNAELLDKLPPNIREQIVLMMSSHRQVGAAPNPIAEKLTPEHIGSIITNAENNSQRDFNSKWFNLAYVILALGFLVFVFVYLPTIDKALFLEVLKLLITFLGGLGAGFGVSKIKKGSE